MGFFCLVDLMVVIIVCFSSVIIPFPLSPTAAFYAVFSTLHSFFGPNTASKQGLAIAIHINIYASSALLVSSSVAAASHW